METSISEARKALLETIGRVERIVPLAESSTILALHAVTPHLQAFDTTFGREVSAYINQCSKGY